MSSQDSFQDDASQQKKEKPDEGELNPKTGPTAGGGQSAAGGPSVGGGPSIGGGPTASGGTNTTGK